jgi:hypothetical protein
MKMTGVYYSTDDGPELIDSLHYFPRDAYVHLTDLMAADARLGSDRYKYRLYEADEDATLTPRKWEKVGYALVAKFSDTPWYIQTTSVKRNELEKFLEGFRDTEHFKYRIATIVLED